MAITAEERWDEAFWEVWSNRLIPKLRAVAPQRTGRLEHAIQPIYYEGAFRVFVRLRGFYWYFQPGLLEEWIRILNAEAPAMLAYANEKAGEEFNLRFVPGLIITESR